MNTRFLQSLRMLFLYNWPQKLGAVAVASLVWWFATVSDTPQTQASRVVGIEVQGLNSTSVATGLPDTAVITIRGPSVLIDRLQPSTLGAIIDLTGRTGDFEEPINVIIPRGVELVSVTPSDVIGTVETLSESVVPVEPVIIGTLSSDALPRVVTEPDHVTVSGLASELQRVNRVQVPVRANPGDRTVQGFATDVNGLPVPGVTLSPPFVDVVVDEQPIFVQRTVPVELLPPAVPGFNVTARLDTPEVTLTGPPSLLAEVSGVRAEAGLDGLEPEAGTFTVPVILDLPEGLGVSVQPQAVIRLTPPALEE